MGHTLDPECVLAQENLSTMLSIHLLAGDLTGPNPAGLPPGLEELVLCLSLLPGCIDGCFCNVPLTAMCFMFLCRVRVFV